MNKWIKVAESSYAVNHCRDSNLTDPHTQTVHLQYTLYLLQWSTDQLCLPSLTFTLNACLSFSVPVHFLHTFPASFFFSFARTLPLILWPWNMCSRKWMSARGTSGFNTDSLFWLMLQESASHCRHKKIQLHALWFIKTSKETLSPFIDLPSAFSCLSTWSWQIDQNSFPCK